MPVTFFQTYHEVVDEIYYKVNHLEPWERGSRNTSGITGMCGGVRGVSAGGTDITVFSGCYRFPQILPDFFPEIFRIICGFCAYRNGTSSILER
jgi:hypothetical protein